MASSWIASKIGNSVSNAVAPTISGYVATAGSFAGDTVASVGNSINGVGQSISGTISRYGNGAKDYGNAIKDYTKAPGTRSSSAKNPLGLSDTYTGGKNSMNSSAFSNPTAGNRAAPKKAIEAPKPAAKKPAPSPAAVKPKTPVASGTRSATPANIAKPKDAGSAAKGGAQKVMDPNNMRAIAAKARERSAGAYGSAPAKAKPVARTAAAKNPLGI